MIGPTYRAFVAVLWNGGMSPPPPSIRLPKRHLPHLLLWRQRPHLAPSPGGVSPTLRPLVTQYILIDLSPAARRPLYTYISCLSSSPAFFIPPPLPTPSSRSLLQPHSPASLSQHVYPAHQPCRLCRQHPLPLIYLRSPANLARSRPPRRRRGADRQAFQKEDRTQATNGRHRRRAAIVFSSVHFLSPVEMKVCIRDETLSSRGKTHPLSNHVALRAATNLRVYSRQLHPPSRTINSYIHHRAAKGTLFLF